MSTLTSPRPAVQPKSLPLTVSLTLAINGQRYDVAPLDPGEDGSRAFRLTKLGVRDTCYDVIRGHDGIITCDCPHYEAKLRGNTSSPCKHGQALVMVGILDMPCPVAAPLPEPEARTPELVPPLDRFDRDWYQAQNAVVEGRAMWLTSKPQPPEPVSDPTPDHARDIVLVDDDGTRLETPAEMDRRHRDEHDAAHAVASGHAEWLEGRPAEEPCCPGDEPSPCSACLSPAVSRHDVEPLVECPRCGGSGVREFFRPDGPELEECSSCSGTGEVDAATAATLRELMEEADREADDPSGGDWQDESRWGLGPDPAPAPPTLAEWLDLQAAHHRRIGGEKHDWLAGKLAALAGQARFLDATTPDAFDDRLSAMLDAAADAAESRAAACC